MYQCFCLLGQGNRRIKEVQGRVDIAKRRDPFEIPSKGIVRCAVEPTKLIVKDDSQISFQWQDHGVLYPMEFIPIRVTFSGDRHWAVLAWRSYVNHDGHFRGVLLPITVPTRLLVVIPAFLQLHHRCQGVVTSPYVDTLISIRSRLWYLRITTSAKINDIYLTNLTLLS